MSGKNFQQVSQKMALIEQLKIIPIVQLAVQKVGIGRASYYVWRKQDSAFSKAADNAIAEGILFLNDIAEGNLVSLINDKDMQSIRFWLTHRHPAYANKLKVEADVHTDDSLTPEQREFIERAVEKFDLNQKGKV